MDLLRKKTVQLAEQPPDVGKEEAETPPKKIDDKDDDGGDAQGDER